MKAAHRSANARAGRLRRRLLAPLSLRAKLLTYLTLVHLVLGVIAFLVLAESRWMRMAVELLFAVSIGVGFLLVRSFFVPLRMIRTGGDLIEEKDFTVRFRETGQPEMDRLIGIYNRMIEQLREERLRGQEQRSFLDRLVAASPAGVVTLDFDGRIEALNPSAARLLERSAERLVGRAAEDLGAEIARVPIGESRMVDLPGRRLKCSRAEFFDRGFPRSFFVLEELTEELLANEKQAYEKIVRVISHEVNNSVGAVSSLLESARSDSGRLSEETRADLEQALDISIARMRHLGAFMKAFADVVRLPAPDLRRCDLRQLLEDILVLLRPEMERRRIRCSLEGETQVSVAIDKNQIEQVLVNVLKNAMEAIGEEGRIALRLRHDRGRLRLTVTDTGCGIAPDAQANLFTPFYSTRHDGRGLGLTVVREILTQHRFEFALEGRPEGGAEFRILFA